MEARRGQNILVFMVGTLHWLVGYLFNPRCQILGKWLHFAGLSPCLPFWVAHAFSLGQLVVPASGLSSLGRQDTVVSRAWDSWPPLQSSWAPEFTSVTARRPSFCCLHSETDPHRSLIHIDPRRSQTEPQSLVSFRCPLKILPASSLQTLR